MIIDKSLITGVLFYLFASGVLLAAAAVIFSRHPIRAALALVGAFVLSAPLWLLLHAEFLALVLIFVYVGAVMTLFLFVIMMLDLVETPRLEGFTRYFPVGLCAAGGLIALLAYTFRHQAWQLPAVWLPADYSNLKAIGRVLYTQYLLPFELASVLLLVAIVASIALAFRGVHGRRIQRISEQVSVQKSDRLRIIKMGAEKP